MAETKAHNVRIPEWDEAAEIAAETGETVTAMIRRGLRREMDIARTTMQAKEARTRLYNYQSGNQQSIVVSLTDEQARQRMRPGVTLEPL